MKLNQVYETLKAAQARVDNRNLPLKVRIRSKQTVAFCEERIAFEHQSNTLADQLLLNGKV